MATQLSKLRRNGEGRDRKPRYTGRIKVHSESPCDKYLVPRGSIQKEGISDLKGDNQFLSKEIWSLYELSLERDLKTGFKTGFYCAWHIGFHSELGLYTTEY
jgi:hypothetical protein